MQDLNDKITGGTLPAAEWNEVPSELQNVIEKTGQTLSALDLDQLGKAIAVYASGADFYVDSGAVNAYVLSGVGSKQTPPAYFNGMKIRFIPTSTNTGASTVNVATLGAKALKRADGTDLLTTDLQAGIPVQFQYDTGSGSFLRNGESLQDSTETIKGKMAIATLAEVIAGVVSNEAVVPSTLLSGLDFSLGANGYIVFPDWAGNLILQWGTFTIGDIFGGTTTPAKTFPKAFASSVYNLQLTGEDLGGNTNAVFYGKTITTTSFKVIMNEWSSNVQNMKLHWFAVGK